MRNWGEKNKFIYIFNSFLLNDVNHFFFFFQAEDGIRDVAVTGVQTCALPICWKFYATEGTRKYLARAGVEASLIYKISEHKKPSLAKAIEQKAFDLMISIPRRDRKSVV